MNKFLLKIISLSLLIVIILISVNISIDPAKLFNNNYYEKMINIIKNNNHITNVMNYDDRLFNRKFAENLSEKYNILVIGSSRSKLIKNEYFANVKLFNASVNGASIEDLISIYQLYKSYDLLPDSIILGIDPWIFNDNNNQERWKTLKKEYYSFFNKSDQQIKKSNKNITQILSLSYYQESIMSLFKYGFKFEPTSTKDKFNKFNTILNDGSLVYSKKFRDLSLKEVDKQASEYINGDIYSIEKFNEISKTKIDLFEKLIFDIKQNKIRIKFIISPYHPIVYKEIYNNIDYKNVLKTEKYITEFSIKNNIKKVGSFDPKRNNFDNSYFYDGMHCNEKGIIQLLSNLK